MYGLNSHIATAITLHDGRRTWLQNSVLRVAEQQGQESAQLCAELKESLRQAQERCEALEKEVRARHDLYGDAQIRSMTDTEAHKFAP